MKDLTNLRKIAERVPNHSEWEAYSVPGEKDRPAYSAVAIGDYEVNISDRPGSFLTDHHIATFDPPTVLALLSRLEQAEQAVQKVREVAAGWATRDQPFREAILRALDGDQA